MMRSIKRVIRYFLIIIPVTSFYLMCFLYETSLLFKQGLNQHPDSAVSSSSNQLDGKFDLPISSSFANNHRMLMNNEYIASTEGSFRHSNDPSMSQHALFKKHLRSIGENNLPPVHNSNDGGGVIALQQISYGKRLSKQQGKSNNSHRNNALVNDLEERRGEEEEEEEEENGKFSSPQLSQPIRLVLKKFKPATVSMSDLSAFYTPVPDSILLDLTDFAFIKNASDTCVTGTGDAAGAGDSSSGTGKSLNHNDYNVNSSPSSSSVSSYLWPTVPSSSQAQFKVKSNEEVAPFLLAFVHSAPSNFARRKVIRQTWAHPSTLAPLNVKVVFILGLSLDPTINALVDTESAKYSDLVQGNFVDSYKNLTYKHLAGYKWVMRFCNYSKFIMKVDDDAFVDVFKVVSTLKYMFLSDYGNSLIAIRPAGILACSVFPEGTPVRRNGKWALSHAEYPMTTYPEYCSGVGYFASTDVLFKLFNTAHEKTANGSLKNKAIWIDDLFVTGTLAQVARQKHLPMNFQFAYDHRRLRNWLSRKDSKSNSYLIADIGDVTDWQGLMTALWDKTKRMAG